MSPVFLAGALAVAVLLVSPAAAADARSAAERIAEAPLGPGKPSLTRAEAEEDAELLATAMERAYAGRFAVSTTSWTNALRHVRGVPAIASDDRLAARDFCAAVAEAFAAFPDRHLTVTLDNKACRTIPSRPRSRVGVNLARSARRRWTVERRKTGVRTFGIIAISYFPNFADPRWDGFEQAVETLLDADALVLDMRGNGGGDPTRGLWLVRRLYGGEPPSPVARDLMIESPEAQAMAIVSLRRQLARSGTGDVETFVEQRLADAKRRLAAQLKNPETRTLERRPEPGVPFDPKAGFARPVSVLIDSGCASACEGMLTALEAHPYVRTVGGRTEGLVHTRRVSEFVLPNSGIVLKMATAYREFKDGRHLEGVGIEPRVPVETGKDALDTALSEPPAAAR